MYIQSIGYSMREKGSLLLRRNQNSEREMKTTVSVWQIICNV